MLSGRIRVVSLSVASSLLLWAAYPPLDLRVLLWIALVPMFIGISESGSWRGAVVVGALTGTMYGLVVILPLVSALDWTGWATLSPEDLKAMRGRQWWFLHVMWVLVAFWGGGVFWGAYAALLRWLAPPDRPMRLLAVAPALWILDEWLRGLTTWGFHWAFLGNQVAPFANLRQAAALGGVWLLSCLVVLCNVAAMALLRSRRLPEWRRVAVVGLCVMAAAWAWGRVHRVWVSGDPTPVSVVAAQQNRDFYRLSDFADIGIDRSYLLALDNAVRLDPDLIVLPESVAIASLTIDGSTSRAFPDKPAAPLEAWTRILERVLQGRRAVIALGVESIEEGRDYNSIGYWGAEGALGFYHKRKLVPFAEYQPRFFSRFSQRGKSQFEPGSASNVLHTGDLRLGSFVCQEVLYPGVVRRSVVDGANVLVSVGHDGVFSDPRVAQLHAELAQIRAVESGRFLVRAMKTGVTAIVDPTGREVARTQNSEPALIEGQVALIERQNPYVRFGAWPLPVSALVVAWACWLPARREGRSASGG